MKRQTSNINPTAAFLTLGCKVNQYETQVMREALIKHGYTIVAPDEAADVYVINTCTVTGISDRKSRQMIRKAAARNPGAAVVVTGCYVERCPDEVRSMPGVDLILSNREKHLIGEYLSGMDAELHRDADSASDHPHPGLPPSRGKEFKHFTGGEEPRGFIKESHSKWSASITSFGEQTRAMVKIEDGCDSFCSYCIVPHVRGGKISSRPIDSIVQEVQALEKSGYREVVLTGIHLGAYGRDLSDGRGLSHVLHAVHAVEGIQRVRLSSIEPADVTDDLINTVAELPKCAHHFHVSLQSGSDEILNLMRRGYTSADFEALVARIRAAIPDVGLSTDVMVGFPGETEQDFEETCSLIARARFSRLHVFRYSPRAGTPAAKLPNRVQNSVASRRSAEVRTIGDRLAREFRSGLLGQEAEVLVEASREGKDKLLAGFTSNYVRVLVQDAQDELAGQMIKVKLVGIESEYMIGVSDP